MKWLIGILFLAVVFLSWFLYSIHEEVAEVKENCDYQYRVLTQLRQIDRTVEIYQFKAQVYAIMADVAYNSGDFKDYEYFQMKSEEYDEKAEKTRPHPLDPSQY